jgi:hypothetical protein
MATEIEILRLNPSPLAPDDFDLPEPLRLKHARNRQCCAEEAMRALRKRLTHKVAWVSRFLWHVWWKASRGFRFREALFASFSGSEKEELG